jgi:predicted nucleic acid-binding protein
MIGVIDVSGIIEILLNKKKAVMFNNVISKMSSLVVPDLYISELTNTFWKYYTIQEFTKDECIEYIQDGLCYIDSFINSEELWHDAFLEGINNKHSIYDMFYLVAARKNNGILITCDSSLAIICEKNNVQVCY